MKSLLLLLTLSYSFIVHAQDTQHLCSQAKIQHFSKLQKVAEINYPGDSRIDVSFYKLDLNISYIPRFLSGIVTIKAKSLEDNLTNAFFDLKDYFEVETIKVNGNPLTYSFQNDIIDVTLDKEYDIGEEFEIEIK